MVKKKPASAQKKNDKNIYEAFLKAESCLEFATDDVLMSNYYWASPSVRICIHQEDMSQEEMHALLSKKRISLIEGAHLLIGKKLNDTSKIFLTKPLQQIYEMTIKDIRIEALECKTEDNSKNINVFSESSYAMAFDKSFIVEVLGNKHGLEHYFTPIGFINWALSRGMVLNDILASIVGVNQVAENIDPKFEHKVRSYSIVWANPLSPSKIIELTIVATAQALWELDPQITIEEMKTHKCITRLLPEGKEYKNKDILRNKIKGIDPRPLNRRTKKRKDSTNNESFPPRLIPGVIIPNKEQFLLNYFMLEVVCKAIYKVFLRHNSIMSKSEFLRSRLIDCYIGKDNPFLQQFLSIWVEEGMKSK